MQGNDISPTTHMHVACMFEGLLMHAEGLELPKTAKRNWRGKRVEGFATDDPITRSVEYISRTWRANEMPLKSVIHMTTVLNISVEVFTFLDWEYHGTIENWLARKGAAVTVHHYEDVNDLYDDFKYNRDVHTMFTTNEEDAAILGIRATVVQPDGTFGGAW